MILYWWWWFSCYVVSDPCNPMQFIRFLCLWDFSRQMEMEWLPFSSLGIFPTQGLNLGFLHCRQFPALKVDSWPTEPPEKLCWIWLKHCRCLVNSNNECILKGLNRMRWIIFIFICPCFQNPISIIIALFSL